MSELVQSVKDGKLVDQATATSSTATTSKTSSSKLDKDSFLKLLCTQMQYQDPLNPSSNTEYVAQLATFSQLEQLQNLAATQTKSQAFSLVGKEVTVNSSDDSSKSATTVSGKVDFVTISGDSTKLSINGKLYSIDLLTSVTDQDYIKNQNSPGITEAASLVYDANSPKNQSFTVNMGSGDYAAKNVAFVINGTAVDSSLVKVSKGTVTIDKSAFSQLANGAYKVSVAFDNTDYTTVSDKVTLQIKNSNVTNSTSTNSSETSSDSTTSNNSKDSSSKDAVTV